MTNSIEKELARQVGELRKAYQKEKIKSSNYYASILAAHKKITGGLEDPRNTISWPIRDSFLQANAILKKHIKG